MSYFFAEKMAHCHCMMATEIGWEVINRLGSLEIAAVQDQVISYNNPFVRSFKHCEDAMVKLISIRSFLAELPQTSKLIEAQDYSSLLKEFDKDVEASKVHGHLFMNTIEDEIHATFSYLLNQKQELEHSRSVLKSLILQLSLLLTMSGSQHLLPKNDQQSIFESKCLCISRRDLLMLKKSVFRMTHGNSWMHEMELSWEAVLPYLALGERSKWKAVEQLKQFLSDKIACLIVFQRGEKNMLVNKITKLLSCLNSFPLLSNLNRIELETQGLRTKINDTEHLEQLTLENMQNYVDKLYSPKEGSSVSWLVYMEAYTCKEREIYRILSCSTERSHLTQFKIYIPSSALPLHIQVSDAYPPLILQVVENSNPPSKFDRNPALNVPQEIVNTYGVPSYNQINPAVFYIVTFGFFIGVMFGDIGHMLLALPLLIYLKADRWFYSVLFFMGYCGLIYNQFFGLNLGIFPSCYSLNEQPIDAQLIDAQAIEECVYPIGIDSVWSVSSNGMQFINSLKMKMAVIFGVLHMLLGLTLRLVNNIRQGKYSKLLLTTLPQIMFMSCTFLYMDYLILFKWLSVYPDTQKAPSIISTMISIFVGMAAYKPNDLLFWESERQFERLLIIVSLCCVPIMLIGEPLWEFRRRKGEVNLGEQMIHLAEEHQKGDVLSDQGSSEDSLSKQKNEGMVEQELMSEVLVHQFIETIEYVLGTVSNTASYLRLWALSLAHAQLSEVIFSLILKPSLIGGYSSIVMLFLAFPFFLTVTFGVLICMDTLECFLHSLRLHWVEFQNKFYRGNGYVFTAFSFRALLSKKY